MAATTVPMASEPREAPLAGRRYVWELPVRLTHWTNALSIFVLFATGIYIGDPQLAPSGEAYNNFLMGRIREIHFIAAYVLMLGIVLRVYWFFAGNNYARSGFPFFWRLDWYKAVIHQVIEYMKPDRGHVHIGHNSLAGASYYGFFAMCGFEAVTGFALYGESNPGGFWDRLAGWCVPMLGGSFRVHTWHHMVAWFIIIFVLFHIYIVLYDSNLYKDGLVDSIIAGPKFYDKGDLDVDKWSS